MISQPAPIRILDAFTQPRQVVLGCQHQLGCKCDPPYWLRQSSATELRREQWIREFFRVQL